MGFFLSYYPFLSYSSFKELSGGGICCSNKKIVQPNMNEPIPSLKLNLIFYIIFLPQIFASTTTQSFNRQLGHGAMGDLSGQSRMKISQTSEAIQ